MTDSSVEGPTDSKIDKQPDSQTHAKGKEGARRGSVTREALTFKDDATTYARFKTTGTYRVLRGKQTCRLSRANRDA